jgi:hypothetical protein
MYVLTGAPNRKNVKMKSANPETAQIMEGESERYEVKRIG